MDTAADALVRTHGTGVDLGGAGLADGAEFLLLGSRGIHDTGQFLFLGLQVLATQGKRVFQHLDVALALGNLHLDVADVLLGNLAEQFLVLDLFVDGIILAAVGDVLELAAVFGDLVVAIDRILFVDGDRLVVLVDHGRQLGLFGFHLGHLGLQSLHFGGQLTAELHDFVDVGIGLLKLIQGLQLLLHADFGIREILLEGDKGFMLVDRGLDFLDFFCHIFVYKYFTGLLLCSWPLMRTAKVGKFFFNKENNISAISISPSKWPISITMKPSGVKKWW